MAITKDVLRSLTPPMLWKMARLLKSDSKNQKSDSHDAPLPSWQAAVSRSDGWDSQAVTDKTLEVMLKVRDGLLEFEQDTVAREKIIYSVPILAFLLLVLSGHKNSINFIDFGGGLGTNYFQNRKLLKQLAATSVQWNIIERPIFTNLGREHFQTSELKFFYSLDDVLVKVNPIPDALLFSGSLQYIEEPFTLLNQVTGAGIRIIAFDRLPISSGNEHAIFIQKLPPHVYGGATLPWRQFSKDALTAWLVERGFTLVELFEQEFNHCGMIFVKRI